MQEAKRQVAIANSEFQAVSSTMDDWTKSTDGLGAKLKQLDSNLKSQKSILSDLERQYELTVQEMGEGSKAADDLKIKINKQQAVVNKTEREMRNYESALGELEKSLDETGDEAKTAGNAIEDMGEKSKDAEDGFTVLKGAVATFAGNALTALVGGIKDVIGSFVGLADETREYRTEMGKLETAFTSAGFASETATDTYKDLYAVLGDEGQTVEAANMLAKLCDTEEELAEWTTIATGVYGTFGSSLPIESLAEAANETAKTGAVTGALADALNWAGVSEETFQSALDGCSTEQERQALITDTLNGLYARAAKAYEETNKSVMDANRANSDYTDTLAAMGTKVEPVMTTVKEGFNSLLQEALKLIEGVDMEAFSAKIQEAFSVLTDTVIPAVKEGLGWIIDNKETIIAGLTGIAAGFAAFKVASLIMGVVEAFKAFKLANEGATVAQWLFNAAVNANPLMIIVTIVAAVVAAIVAFVATNDEARAKIAEIWGKITEGFSKFVDTIKKFFTETIPNFFKSFIDWVKENWESLLLMFINPFAGLFKYFYDNNKKFKEFVDNAIKYIKQLPEKVWTWLKKTAEKIATWSSNAVKSAKETGKKFIDNVIDFVKQLPSKISEWLSSALRKVSNWGSDLVKKGKQAASDLFDSIVDTIKGLPDKIKDIGSDIVEGLWNGIKDMGSWISGKLKGFGDSVLGSIKDFFGIHSPSKLMADEVGKWIPEGIAVGIEKNAKSVLNSMRDLSINSVGAARNGLTGGSAINTAGSSVVNNFYQTNNSPKALSRLEIYRQSKNLLGYTGGV